MCCNRSQVRYSGKYDRRSRTMVQQYISSFCRSLSQQPVLATCDIRPPVEAFENTQSRLLLLADSEEEEYNRKHSPAHLHKGVTYTVHGILTFIKRLTGLCLQSLHHRFVVWTKPGPTSLYAGDDDRPCQKQVRTRGRKRAPPSATHYSPPTGETTHLYQNGSDAPGASGQDGSNLEASAFHRSARDVPPLASSGIQAVLEIQVQSSFCQTKDLRRDRSFDQGDGKQQSTVGSRADSWRITQAGSSRLQTHHPEVHEICAHKPRHEDRSGAPSYTLMLSRSGPATFSRSPTFSSVRSSPSSSSNCTRAK